jgi:hypothetical protein
MSLLGYISVLQQQPTQSPQVMPAIAATITYYLLSWTNKINIHYMEMVKTIIASIDGLVPERSCIMTWTLDGYL